MRQLAKWLVGLYPQWWKQGYGDEFLVMLDDLSLRPGDLFDIGLGVLDAHIQLNHRRNSMQMSGTFRGIGLVLLAAAGLMLVGMFAPFLSESQAYMLVWFIPFVSMLAADTLHARSQDDYPTRSRKLLRLAQVESVLIAPAFVYGVFVQLIGGGPAPTLGLFLLILVSGFVVWVSLTAITGWQTDTLHPALVAVGLLSSVAFCINVLALFTTLPLPASWLVSLWLGLNAAWIFGLGVSLFGHANTGTPQAAG